MRSSSDTQAAKIQGKKRERGLDPAFVRQVKTEWGVALVRCRPDIPIDGSPERALSRGVVQDASQRLFLVETFPEARFRLRNRVAQTLYHLNRNGLTRALAPRPSRSGRFLVNCHGRYCQISPFVQGTGIQRPQWLESGPMGEQMADFLIRLHAAGPSVLPLVRFPVFSLKHYIYQLFRDMAVHDPDRTAQYRPYLSFLEQDFMAHHDRLAKGFVHGDFHPLNVIWDHHRIKAVIDWEFCGIKPKLHDAANLVGCAGIEHPEGLVMPMVTTFLHGIRTAGIIGQNEWRFFPEYVVALRFAWLSEWLRKKDGQMLETESAFMKILVDERNALKQIWNLS